MSPQSGSMSIVVLVCTVLMVALGAATVDLARVFGHRRVAATAADAGALAAAEECAWAGASCSPALIRRTALAYARANAGGAKVRVEGRQGGGGSGEVSVQVDAPVDSESSREGSLVRRSPVGARAVARWGSPRVARTAPLILPVCAFDLGPGQRVGQIQTFDLFDPAAPSSESGVGPCASGAPSGGQSRRSNRDDGNGRDGPQGRSNPVFDWVEGNRGCSDLTTVGTRRRGSGPRSSCDLESKSGQGGSTNSNQGNSARTRAGDERWEPTRPVSPSGRGPAPMMVALFDAPSGSAAKPSYRVAGLASFEVRSVTPDRLVGRFVRTVHHRLPGAEGPELSNPNGGQMGNRDFGVAVIGLMPVGPGQR
ncbi:MAG: pilus assembly protein TadG-related protein [Acidimicrobiales bacterium]